MKKNKNLCSDFAAARQRLFADARACAARPFVFFRSYTALLDDFMRHLFDAVFGENMPAALLATGGYGRGEVYPFSDVDFALLLPEDALPEDFAGKIENFVQTLWDCGLSPAPQTGGTQALCALAAADLNADTAFLEARFLAGNAAAAEDFLAQSLRQRDFYTFIEGKLLEQHKRHAKAQGSGSLLEPNLKTAPGGLRDIHTLLWLARLQGLPEGFAALKAQNILTPTEARLLMVSHRCLAQMRIALHLCAARAQDWLIFDYQRQMADLLGFAADGTLSAHEKLMRKLYRATKTVKQMNGILLPVLQERIYMPVPRRVRQIDGDFYQTGTRIAAYDKTVFRRQPRQILRLVEVLQQSGDMDGIAPQTLRAWFDAACRCGGALYADAENRRRFLGFFRYGHNLTHILRLLNLYGVLGRYLPAFGKIVGLLQHDLFHIYPVDEHILTTVRNLRRFSMEAYSHELPFAWALMADFPRKDILYLAGFFHDIAKGRGGRHEELGAQDAAEFARSHGLDDSGTQLLCLLVRQHLLFSVTAQKNDIHDARVIENFCREIVSAEHLTALYLLTVADIRATNPKIWNNWKAELFAGLFQAASDFLRGTHTPRGQVIGEKYRRIQQTLDAAGLDKNARRKLTQKLGEAYFVRHDAAETAGHLQLIAHAPDTPAADVQIQPGGIFRVIVYLPNRERIFARLCRIFNRRGLGIVYARAFVTAHDFVLDTFTLTLPETFKDTDRRRIQAALAQDLAQFVRDPDSLPENIVRRESGRRSRYLPIMPQVKIEHTDEGGSGHYAVQITAANRIGLLGDIAEALSAHHTAIRHARIHTLDERAEDLFIVYNPALDDVRCQLQLKEALAAAIA